VTGQSASPTLLLLHSSVQLYLSLERLIAFVPYGTSRLMCFVLANLLYVLFEMPFLFIFKFLPYVCCRSTRRAVCNQMAALQRQTVPLSVLVLSVSITSIDSILLYIEPDSA
jgi:hypothetical protein